jgi:transposase
MPWFLKLMEELKIECRVGHPAEVRAAEPRKQKHDRRDARLLLNLLAENRFPAIWMLSTEQRDLRTLLRHRHQWVWMRTRVQHTLQSLALANGLRRGATLWSQVGQHALQALPLAPFAGQRRCTLGSKMAILEWRHRAFTTSQRTSSSLRKGSRVASRSIWPQC